MKRRSDEFAGEPKGKWLLTFNDMITLLLTFFVLIISMSVVEKVKTGGVADSVKKVAGQESSQKVRKGGVQSIVPSLRDKDIERARNQIENGGSDPLDARRAVMEGMLQKVEGVKTTPTKNGLALSLNESFLFSAGSAEISENGQKILDAMGDILRRADVEMRVEGHTDSTPINNDKYPSNWELSMARAAGIVRWLTEKEGVTPERLSAAGYADTKPRAPNDSEQNRQENRRVDIVLNFLKH